MKKATVWAVAVVLLFAAIGAWVQLGYYQQAADKSAQYERWSKNEIRTGCVSLGSPSKAECAYQAKQTAHENKRDEYDLYAQRTSALWAGIMAIAALVGIGLSGIGVYLVFTTFDATRQGNKIAQEGLTQQRKIDELEYRPIMVFEGTDIVPWGDNGDVLIPTHWRNVGRTAALVTYVSVKRAFTNSFHIAHHIEELKTDREILHFNEEEIVAPNHQVKNSGLLLRKENFRRGALSSPIKSIIGPKLIKVDQFALFICAIKYRMALGDDPREFASQVIFSMEPEWEGEAMNGRFIYKVAMGHTKLS